MTRFLLSILVCFSFTLSATEIVARQPVSATNGVVIAELREARFTFSLDTTKVDPGTNLAVYMFRKEQKTWIRKEGVPVSFKAADGVRFSEQIAFRFAPIVNGRESVGWSQTLSTSLINWLDTVAITPVPSNDKWALSVGFTDPCRVETCYRYTVKSGYVIVATGCVEPQKGIAALSLPVSLPAGSYVLMLSPVCLTEFGVSIGGYSPNFQVTIPATASN